MGFDVSSAAANAVLYSILTFFTILAIISGGYLNSVLPPRVVSCCLLRRRVRNDGDDDDAPTTEKGEADHFLSARNSASAREIALSFFASGMGAWVRSLYNIYLSLFRNTFDAHYVHIFLLLLLLHFLLGGLWYYRNGCHTPIELDRGVGLQFGIGHPGDFDLLLGTDGPRHVLRRKWGRILHHRFWTPALWTLYASGYYLCFWFLHVHLHCGRTHRD